MGGGLEFDLTHGAVTALWSSPPPGYRPVLQVADVRHVPDATSLSPAPARLQRYSLTLSDGVHSQPAVLAPSLNHLGRDAALRRGCVVRLLDFVVSRRDIIVLQLEILQTECPLIGNLKLYEPIRKSGGFTATSTRYALRPDYEPYYGAQHIQQSCIASAAEKSDNGLSHHGHCGASNPAAGGDTPSSAAVFAEAVPALWKTVGQIKDGSLGYSYMSEFITVKATVSSVETQHLCYAACPLMVNGKPCNVKATSNGDGTWLCKRCGVSFKSCDYGFSVRIQIQDHTGTAFATAYEEAAKEIFGCTTKDLYMMKYKEQDYAQLNDIVQGVVCKQYVFQLKVEANPFYDWWCAECIILKAEEVDPSAESRRLLGVIDMDLLPEGLGSCLELGSSMPTWCSSPSDLKGRSIMRCSNSSYAIRPARSARERCLRSANLLGQQSNGHAAMPAARSPSALGVCGRGDNHGARTCPLGIGGHRSSAPADGSMGNRLYDAGGSVGGLYGAPPAKTAPDARRKRGTQTSAHGAEESRGEP